MTSKTIKDILKLRTSNPKSEKDIIKSAYALASKAHSGQTRASGVPYIQHLLEVGLFLARWKRDYDIIVAGILHDTIEDTPISLIDIESKFGKRVAKLVDGVSWVRTTKDGKLTKDWPATYKKFVSYSLQDIDLIFIKAADLKSNISEMHIPSKREFFEKKAGPRNKGFWIPFFKEAGLNKFAEQLEEETDRFVTEEIPVILYDYISKEELKKIQNKILAIRGINSLK